MVLEQPAAQPAGPGHGPSLLTIVGSAFLAFNAAAAVYSADKGLGAVSFAAFSCLDLLLLLYCLRQHGRAPPGSPRREHLKVAAWLLATMLTFAFWPPLLDLCFPNAAENSSMALSFRNDNSCAPYLPSVPLKQLCR